jgi:hypothetical protein
MHHTPHDRMKDYRVRATKKEEQNHFSRLKDEQQSIGRKHNLLLFDRCQ